MGQVHFYVEESSPSHLAASEQECKDCGHVVRLDIQKARYGSQPVKFCFQDFICPKCKGIHFFITAGSKNDCIAVEPVINAMASDFYKTMVKASR